MWSWSFLSLLSVSNVVAVNFLPPAIPLSVKTPYLNTWLTGGSTVLNSDYVTEAWPVFGSSGDINGWASYVRVDNVAYRVLGDSLAIGSAGKTQSISVRIGPFGETRANAYITLHSYTTYTTYTTVQYLHNM
jgi:hypothetical protein